MLMAVRDAMGPPRPPHSSQVRRPWSLLVSGDGEEREATAEGPVSPRFIISGLQLTTTGDAKNT
jgi:hypothetical protein